MNNEKKILRFVCRMVEDEGHVLTAADMDRKFIMSYFLADDTISIFEPPTRNSGIIGGKFLERGAILKPKSDELYVSADMYVGKVMTVYNRSFILSEADGYTYSYMEENEDVFVRSNFAAVMAKVGAAGAGACAARSGGQHAAGRDALHVVVGPGGAQGAGGRGRRGRGGRGRRERRRRERRRPGARSARRAGG